MTDYKLLKNLLVALVRWFDNDAVEDESVPYGEEKVDWVRCLPFIAMHFLCFAAIWVGWSWTAVVTAAALYLVRMLAITGFYHRYFSHRTFKISRAGQFIGAVIGNASAQRGPLWWAAHHRYHHLHSDRSSDLHSPQRRGFWWSHVGWFTCKSNFKTRLKAVPDLAVYPELRFLDRFDSVVPVLLAAALFLAGVFLEKAAPALGTNGLQMLVWGFFISTVVLFHATFTINSVAHQLGSKRYPTNDESRNNLFLSLLTLGEGWHNNHHYYPVSARQGFYWWEIDPTYYVLLALRRLGLVWALNPLPDRVFGDSSRTAKSA